MDTLILKMRCFLSGIKNPFLWTHKKTKHQELIDRAYLRANSIDAVRGLAYRNGHIREAKELERAWDMIIDLVKELEED